ncbi:patatin-like phospholipase family protein [Marinilabiliaceae bacterium ANBcel2]|nr:patatin-like phospholipase family protein [Marinilabiliaceae bacterium ANBcel2]
MSFSLQKTKRVDPLPASKLSKKVIEFKGGSKTILCIDGGGVRGIVTLHALKALEKELKGRCIDIFDMFAGTSTGAIIAGALAYGVPVDDLIKLYRNNYKKIFTRSKKRYLLVAAGILTGAACGFIAGTLKSLSIGIAAGIVVGFLISMGGIFIERYDNKNMIKILKLLFKDTTLAECHKDIFITGKDTVRGETTYFTAFHNGKSDIRGTYKDVSLASAITASAGSAPTYFRAVGRFIDGGLGSFNNVSYAAPVEALRYSAKKIIKGWVNDKGKTDPKGKWPLYYYPEDDNLYKPGKTKVVSFGTGRKISNMEKGEAMAKRRAWNWLGWIISELMNDASEQQSYIAEKDLDKNQSIIEYSRFQLFWSQKSLEVLKDINNEYGLNLKLPKSLRDGTKYNLDAVKKFNELDQLGVAFGKWLSLSQKKGDPKRFYLKGYISLGHPVISNPARFHIDIYSKQVKKELQVVK